MSGVNAACELAALDEVDQVMSAIVGAAGLLPTLAAVKAGKRVLLANKESLVTCGRIFMDAVRENKSQLFPSTANITRFFRACRKLFSNSWVTHLCQTTACRALF